MFIFANIKKVLLIVYSCKKKEIFFLINLLNVLSTGFSDKSKFRMLLLNFPPSVNFILCNPKHLFGLKASSKTSPIISGA
jgi:hypothetical protein